MKQLFVLALSLLFITQAFSQNNPDNRSIAINNYVTFSNESCHGLLIIHRLLELYNQEVNKLVNLPNYKYNLFSNSDFPENIFQDKNGAFYKVSPYKLYENALATSKFLSNAESTKANRIMEEMKSILDDLEGERYAIGTLIANLDISQKSNLLNVYNALDACVEKYDLFEKKRKELSSYLKSIAPEAKKNDKFNKSFLNAYYQYENSIHAAFDALRTENTASAKIAFNNLKKSHSTFRELVEKQTTTISPRGAAIIKELSTAINKQNDVITKMINNAATPSEYDQYGICYYFYNIQLAGTTNKYGTGTIERANEWIHLNGNQYMLGFERPHFYKVIRPKEILEEAKQEEVIIPTVVENRKIISDKSKQIDAGVEKLLIEVYDHQEFDYDTISLQFNGKWILKNQLITKEPIRLYLPLEKGKDNFLILYADNLGLRPPNTCAIRYQNKQGKYKEVVLRSDFNESEMIIIRRD